jgi:hypothetical protein
VWSLGVAGARGEDVCEVLRFEARTAHHEAGHKLSGVNAAKSIYGFFKALPAVLPAQWSAPKIHRFNEVLKALCTDFYVRMAHVADKYYDLATSHGVIQGAESVPSTGLGKDTDRPFGSSGVPLPPVNCGRHITT